MKKILAMMVAVTACSLNALADGVCATLSHGDQLSAFYGVNAYNEAYEAAADGDIITLSKGQFTAPANAVEKQVKVIGAFGLKPDATEATYFPGGITIKADDVLLEGLYFSSSVRIGQVNNCIIRRCNIDDLNTLSSCKHTNTVVDQCAIRTEGAISGSVNYTIKNSTINYFYNTGSSATPANILNNVVYFYSSNNRPYAVYKNNILGISTSNCGSSSTSGTVITYPYTVPSVGEFYSNRFFIWRYSTTSEYTLKLTFASSTPNADNTVGNSENTIKQTSDGSLERPIVNLGENGNGQDGTPVGPYGGSGFRMYPALPRVTAATISDRTDDDGKLSVSITVSAE